ncbi:unnamed protein product, partial [marine sediment metagenome]
YASAPIIEIAGTNLARKTKARIRKQQRYCMRRLTRIMEEARAVAKVKDALVWVDLEMTGLDTRKDRIMEMACLITDANLNIVAEVPTAGQYGFIHLRPQS